MKKDFFMNDQVILVDDQDTEIGSMVQLAVHREGLLHRAFSVFIFNSAGGMLLQQRAAGKYHSGGLWSNAYCSKGLPGESVHAAVVRRLKEEMGMQCKLQEVFSFVYKAKLDHDRTEYEYDHVVVGLCDDKPEPDNAEVAGWRYLCREDLHFKISLTPERYTEWFKLCIKDFQEKLYSNDIIKS